jgi:hypothetical protein
MKAAFLAHHGSSNKLTKWSNTFLQNLIVAQPIRMCPASYGTQKFITMIARDR